MSADMQIRRIALPDTLTQQMTRGDESPRRYDELKLKLRLFGKFHRFGGGADALCRSFIKLQFISGQ
jgi:hypothetical protein